jgi:hypothetical protein
LVCRSEPEAAWNRFAYALKTGASLMRMGISLGGLLLVILILWLLFGRG